MKKSNTGCVTFSHTNRSVWQEGAAVKKTPSVPGFYPEKLLGKAGRARYHTDILAVSG